MAERREGWKKRRGRDRYGRGFVGNVDDVELSEGLGHELVAITERRGHTKDHLSEADIVATSSIASFS